METNENYDDRREGRSGEPGDGKKSFYEKVYNRDSDRSGNRRDDDRGGYERPRREDRSGNDRSGNDRGGYDRRSDDRFNRPDNRRNDGPRGDRYGADRGGYGGGNDRPRRPFGSRSDEQNDTRRDSDRRSGYDRGGHDDRFNRRSDRSSGPNYDRPRSSDRDRPHREESRNRFGNERGYGDRSGYDRSGSDRREDRSGNDRSGSDRSGYDRFNRRDDRFNRRADESRNVRPGYDRPRRDDRSGDTPRSFNRRDDDRGGYERPRREDRSGNDRSGYDRSGSDRSGNDRSGNDRGGNDQFNRRSSGGYEERSGFDRPRRPFGEGNDAGRRDFDRRNESFNRRDEGRGYDRPRRPSGSRFEERGDRFNRRDDRRQSDHSESADGGERQAPNYNFDRLEERYPRIKKQTPQTEPKKPGDGTIRLNRYIANAGVCSRRDADTLIANGEITVNGEVVTEMGHKVKPGDTVKYGDKVLNPEKMTYVLLNKPKDYITTTDDPNDRHTVMELVADATPYRIYPVGRLDRNTTGLLLLTNDGELAEKLTHPSNNIRKIYQVEIDKPITTEHFEAIRDGIELEDGFIKPDDLGIVTPDAQVVGIEIHSGRNRIVRRIFEHFGYEVTKLDRTVYAGLTKKELPRGKWRYLSEKEVIRLKFLK